MVTVVLLWLSGAGPAWSADGEARARLQAEPARVWEVLSDLGAWPEVFPSITRVEIYEIDARHARLRQVTRAMGTTVSYTLNVSLIPEERRLELALDPAEPSDVDEITATWRVVALEDRGARVELRSRVVSGHPIPDFLEGRLVRRSVRDSLDALVAEVERRARFVGVTTAAR